MIFGRKIRKAADCRVVVCVNDHVHLELLGEDGKPFAEMVFNDVDEATKLAVQIEQRCDEIMKAREIN